MCDWQKRLQLYQERISSLTYWEGLICHRFESSWINYIIISGSLSYEYILTSHWLSLSLHFSVFPHISTDIVSPINQNETCAHVITCTLAIWSRPFENKKKNLECVTLIVTLRILQEKSVFEIVNVSKDCTDDKLHKTYHELVTKYCLQLSQEVYVIKTTYSKLFQSTWEKGFKMCC